MYDFFISYKHLDALGNLTRDFEIAKILYNHLTSLGYKVFFSSEALKEFGTSRYKAKIDAALDESKAMIVILTKVEYAESHWIKYEWDSFFNDFLSSKRENANLFTLVENIKIGELPRTLRNVQNFDYTLGVEPVLNYMKNVIPLLPETKIKILAGNEIQYEDIVGAVALDHTIYGGWEHVLPEECWRWHKLNPDIYILVKDTATNKIVGYLNVAPVTEECYKKIKSGEFLTTNITSDMILSYDMPFTYYVYFFSIAVHPDYRGSNIFYLMYNALIDRFIRLGKQEAIVKSMIADAITDSGEKFCKLFGMEKITESTHASTLYEILMIPPKFKILTKKTKELYDFYASYYKENLFMFDKD